MSDYWFCVKHHAVEDASGCPSIDRLGPYATREDAEEALLSAEKRNEAWDNDPAWNDDVGED